MTPRRNAKRAATPWRSGARVMRAASRHDQVQLRVLAGAYLQLGNAGDPMTKRRALLLGSASVGLFLLIGAVGALSRPRTLGELFREARGETQTPGALLRVWDAHHGFYGHAMATTLVDVATGQVRLGQPTWPAWLRWSSTPRYTFRSSRVGAGFARIDTQTGEVCVFDLDYSAATREDVLTPICTTGGTQR